MAEKRLFNDNWFFRKEKEKESYNCNEYKAIDIPHDWLIYDSFNLYEDSVGHYKKEFEYSVQSGERVFLRFEGVYMDSQVFLNGKPVFSWKYGYSTFEFEITPYIKDGVNTIEVKCNFKSPNSRWYSGAGIYRNVWLITKKDVCIVSDGIYISSERIDDNIWKTYVDTELDMTEAAEEDSYSIRYRLIDENSVEVVNYSKEIGKTELVSSDFIINSPLVWDIDHPHMYTLSVSLIKNGHLLECEKVAFGYRQIEYKPDEGFILNGRKVKLKGVCNHHDLGALGAAFNKTAAKRQLAIMKQMGINALRASHNMAAPELIELANEMGILINAESFDMWEGSKTEYDYARFFKEWHDKDVRSWVKRDRNAPCIIMWCIGNEIYDTHKDEHGQDITRNLMNLVDKYDYRHNAMVTIGSNYMPWENARNCADIVKLAGYNYAEYCYEEHHKEHPDWIIYGSETASIVASRGIYHFPAEVPVLDDDDLQCSALGNSTTSWGAKSIDACITDERDAYYSAGTFLWSGFDYIGEPTPYHTKNSYFGQVDTAGFPKDSFYRYQAEWTDYHTNPMVHIYPYWDFNEGQMIDVTICSNGPKVELLVNNESYGMKVIDHLHGKELTASWKVPYHKGSIKAIAYDENDNIIAEDMQESFGDAYEIVAEPDKEVLKADGTDLIFVEIKAKDIEGHIVHNANNRINVEVSGAGRLIGLDNGDSTDYDSYKGLSKCLFSGKLLAIIAATTETGDINVKLSSKGLKGTELKLCSRGGSTEPAAGVSAIENNSSEYTGTWIEDMSEIPVRKIEIIAENRKLTKDNPECEINIKVYPDNATYDDIKFRVTTDNGVTSNIAKIEEDKGRWILKAVGDGSFRLRCTINNGRDHAEVISQLEFTANGLGNALSDVYGFVSGSLYTYSKGNITNGNERGAATPRDHESILYYDNLEFGDYGSDTIHIPIFELENKPLEFEIWEGKPGSDNATKLLDAVYNKPSIWNTYQEETFILPKRIKNQSGIGFVFNRKAHIKGFYFTKYNKAFCRNGISECTSIYGDSYTIDGDYVTGIGNNVTFVFENMDFGEEGISSVEICGRTRLDTNTIIMKLIQEDNTIVQDIEFKGSQNYQTCSFPVEPVQGKYDVMLVFLPGADFDFGWFRFS